MKNKNDTLIPACGIYYDSNGIQHTKYLRKHFTIAELKQMNNPRNFDLTYINNVVIDTDTDTIIQRGGWSPAEGLFCRI